MTARQYVGTLVSEDLRILIRPKIELENVFLMLAVALRSSEWRQETFGYKTTGDLLPAVVAFFTRSAELTLLKGVYRSYQHRRERLTTVRGRLDLPGQFAQGGAVYPVPCRFNEFTSDVIENRYLKAGIRRALRVPGIPPQVRRRLRWMVAALEEVRDVPVRPDLLDSLSFHRMQHHYETTLRLARLVLENLTLQDEWGTTAASSFMIDMNFLFERFVTDRLQDRLWGRLEVVSQYSTHLDVTGHVRIRPDLVFHRWGEPVFAGDLKYKRAKKQRDLPTSDHHQLLAYTSAMNLPEGVLIYCQDPDARGPRHESITVRNVGKVLHAWGLDFSGSAADVEAEVERVAGWIAEQANRAARQVSPALSVAS